MYVVAPSSKLAFSGSKEFLRDFSAVSPSGPGFRALLMRIHRQFSPDSTSSTSRLISFLLLTSPDRGTTCPVIPFPHVEATISNFSSIRPTTYTLAPLTARACSTLKPMPDPANRTILFDLASTSDKGNVVFNIGKRPSSSSALLVDVFWVIKTRRGLGELRVARSIESRCCRTEEIRS